MDEVEPHDGHQHQQPGGLGEDEELDRRFDPPLVTPEGDEEVERHQHHLEEEIEENEVEGHEHAGQTGRRPHDVEVEESHPGGDSLPRSRHRQSGQGEGEHEHDEAQPIHGQVEADAQLGDPGNVDLFHPPAGSDSGRSDEMPRPYRQAQSQAAQREGQRRPPGPARMPLAEDPGEESAGQRDDDEQRQDHRNTPSATKTSTPAAATAT